MYISLGNRQVIWVKGCALLAAVEEVVVTHDDGLVLSTDTGVHYLADEEGVVTLGNLTDDFAVPPCGGG